MADVTLALYACVEEIFAAEPEPVEEEDLS